MASNQDKAVEIARETVQLAEIFMDTLVKLQDLEAKRSNSNITLADFDAAYAATSGITHITGAALTGVLSTSTPAIVTFMEAGFHDDNFQQVRP